VIKRNEQKTVFASVKNYKHLILFLILTVLVFVLNFS